MILYKSLQICQCLIFLKSSIHAALGAAEMRGEKSGFLLLWFWVSLYQSSLGSWCEEPLNCCKLTLSTEEWMMCGIVPIPCSCTFSKLSVKSKESVKLAVPCTCLFLTRSQRGTENRVTICKSTKDKSWFCLSGTFLSEPPVAYHSLHSFSSKLSYSRRSPCCSAIFIEVINVTLSSKTKIHKFSRITSFYKWYL